MKGEKMKRKLLITVLTISMLAMAACGKKKEVEVTPEPTEEVVSENEVEAEPTEITEETEAVEVSANTASGTLSDDLYSFQISIGGKVASVPMTYAQFLEFGFEAKTDDDRSALEEGLEPNSRTFAVYHTKGEAEISAYFVNFGENVVPTKECIVGEMRIDSYKIEPSLVAEDITLPKGIKYGVSTLEEIKAAYGEPTDVYESESTTKLIYELDVYNKIELSVATDANVLSTINIENLVPLETVESQATTDETSDEVPEIVSKYVAPTALASSLTDYDYTVEFAGDLYKLPVPVSEFVKNGWKINEQASDSTAVARGYGWVSLMKDNQTMKVTARNYSDKKTSIQNCFISEINTAVFGADLPLKLPEGLEKGMSQDAFMKFISNRKDVKKGTSSSNFEYYTINFGGNLTNKIEVTINTEEKVVQGIYVEYGSGAEESLLK